ncbi:VanW family protein [Candidatus Shapirobacteria bacterium]|nr:VanW family protein [Candidatus Shapirobacteria bacterium]
MIKKTLFYTAIFGLIASLIFFLPLAFGFGKTGKNTFVLDKDYSLLTKKEIISRLALDFPLPDNLTLAGPDQNYQLNLTSISVGINSNQVANNLLFRRLNQGVFKYITAFFSPKHFALEFNYDESILDKYLTDLSSQVNRPFVPSELILDKNEIKLKEGQLGRELKTDTFKQDFNFALSNYKLGNPLPVATSTTGSLPDSRSTDQAIVLAKNLIGKSLTLSGAKEPIIVDDKTLISWLNFPLGCNQDDLDNYVKTLLTSVKKEPVDATFNVQNGKVLEFRPSENGYTLNPDNLSSSICEGLTKLTETVEKSASTTLSLLPISPKINTSDANNLGIKELIGSGTSTFKHSSAIRNVNVERGATIVNRILVAPDEHFSFLKALGDVSIENGYKMAYVIRAGKTELDVGGGICQVSTTFFRAILNSGLDVTNRQNHAYRVQYYEEDMPPGYDATVFIPNPDLKFKNDTGHYLLIQSKYDGKEKRLTYDIYGTSDGRKVEISNYRQWGAQPAPPAVYIDDPTLPVGKTIQDEHAIPGLKTSFDWKVTRDGQVVRQKTFQSSYTPWAAVFRRGVAQ